MLVFKIFEFKYYMFIIGVASKNIGIYFFLDISTVKSDIFILKALWAE